MHLSGKRSMAMNVGKKEEIRFSVIVPIYNSEEYIQTCIKSVLEQTYENFELILINDGSNDASAEICSEFEQKDCRIKVFHQENKGQTAARKKGLAVSSGQYVLFLDSDDWLKKNTLEICVATLTEQETELVVFGSQKHINNTFLEEPVGYKEGLYFRNNIEESIFPSLMMSREGKFFPRALWGKVYKREVIEKHLLLIPEFIRNGEDMCCMISLVMECASLVILPHCLYCYRVGDSQSVSRSGDVLALKRCQKIAAFLKETIERNSWGVEQLYRLIVQQIYSSALRELDKNGIGVQFKKDFEELMNISICSEAVRKADFSSKAKKLQIKQFVLRHRIFPLMLMLRKFG